MKLLKHFCHKLGTQHNLCLVTPLQPLRRQKASAVSQHFIKQCWGKRTTTTQAGQICIRLLFGKEKKKESRIHRIPQNSPTLKVVTNFSKHFQEERNHVKQGSREYMP